MLNQWTLRILPSSADLDTFPLSTEKIIPWIDHPIKKQTEILKLNKWAAKQLQVVKVFFSKWNHFDEYKETFNPNRLKKEGLLLSPVGFFQHICEMVTEILS